MGTKSKVLVYDIRQDGQPVVTLSFGSNGDQPGQFGIDQYGLGGVFGVCLDEDGVLLTTDWLNNRVQLF